MQTPWHPVLTVSRVLAVMFVTCLAGSAWAECPDATRLLPDRTLLYVAVPNVPEFVERFQNTALGRMSADPQMQPLVKSLYGSAADAVAKAQEQIGLSLPELLGLPQGQLAFGLVAPESGPPAPVVILEAGKEAGKLQVLVQQGSRTLEQSGGRRAEESIGGVPVITYTMSEDGPNVTFFEKDGTLVASTDAQIVKNVLAAWNDEKVATLAENSRFAAAMESCRGARSEPPHGLFFIDPIGLVKASSQDNVGMRVGLAMLPTLGLDGILGVGASISLDAGSLDSVIHVHLLLDNPRSGVLDVIALEPVDSTPEPWVPNDLQNYITLNWRADLSYKALIKLVDSFQGEGTLEREVSRRSDRVGFDIANELLPQLDGRMTIVTRIERPIVPESRGWMVGWKVKDAAAVDKLLAAAYTKNEAGLTKKVYGVHPYYQTGKDEPSPETPRRRPRPCFGVLGDYLLMADRPSMYEKAAITLQTPEESLAKALDYKLVVSRLSRRAGSAKPAMISFSRPEEGMRFLYELAGNENVREGMRRGGERNPMLRTLDAAMQDNPLPPFAVLERYLAPAGAMLIDEETGLHYVGFAFRRQ